MKAQLPRAPGEMKRKTRATPTNLLIRQTEFLNSVNQFVRKFVAPLPPLSRGAGIVQRGDPQGAGCCWTAAGEALLARGTDLQMLLSPNEPASIAVDGEVELSSLRATIVETTASPVTLTAVRIMSINRSTPRMMAILDREADPLSTSGQHQARHPERPRCRPRPEPTSESPSDSR